MSFKSKQRAKHSHLFGEDPLNAVADDPLSSPASSASGSSSLRKSSGSSSSIFGDIDVSKLSGRRSLKQDDPTDPELLFGQTRPKPKSSTATTTVLSRFVSAATTNNNKPTTATTRKPPPPPPPPPRKQPTTHTTAIAPRTPPSPLSPPSTTKAAATNIIVIEDEATRAFADDLMVPSVSTPTTAASSSTKLHRDDDDVEEFLNPWSPSVSTPLRSSSSAASSATTIRIAPSEIEPSKRSAFADLIERWNTGSVQSCYCQRNDVDQDEFLNHVAEERRDIGFAGIEQDDPPQSPSLSRSRGWDDLIVDEEDNPWL